MSRDALDASVEQSVSARIRDLRARANISQADLAAKIGRTQATLSLWESGRRTPSVTDLVALARALNVEVGVFFDRATPTAQTPDSPRLLLRAEASRVLHDSLVRDVELFADAAERQKVPAKTVEVLGADAAHTALELLERLDVHEPPIRLGPIARACGVRVLGWDFDEAVSGLLLDLHGGPAIGFNRNHARTRRRFTVAHELGHWLLRHHEHFHVDLTASPAESGEPPGFNWQDERAANHFAAELLMPAHLVEPAHQADPDTASLARRFMVSPQAMTFRVGNLELR